MSQKQAKQAAKEPKDEPSKLSLVDPENPSTTAFGCALEADVRFMEALMRTIPGKQGLSEGTKTSTIEVLGEALKKLGVLAKTLDGIHMDLGEIDPNGPIPAQTQKKLGESAARASEIATGSRETQRKQGELAKYKSAISDIQKRINKIQIQQQESSKVAGQLQVLTDRVNARQAEIVELESNIQGGKKQIQEKEAEVSSKREELQKRLQELKFKMDGLKKNSTSKPGELQEKLRRLRDQKEQLETRVQIARLESTESEETLANPTTVPSRTESTPAPAVETSASLGPMEICGVCTQQKPVEDMVILFNCMHYVCTPCMLAEVNECRKNHRSFKFAFCPSCAEDVVLFDGKGISGSIKATEDGLLYPDIRM